MLFLSGLFTIKAELVACYLVKINSEAIWQGWEGAGLAVGWGYWEVGWEGARFLDPSLTNSLPVSSAAGVLERGPAECVDTERRVLRVPQ